MSTRLRHSDEFGEVAETTYWHVLDDGPCVPWYLAALRQFRDLVGSAGPMAWVARNDYEGAREWEVRAAHLLMVTAGEVTVAPLPANEEELEK